MHRFTRSIHNPVTPALAFAIIALTLLGLAGRADAAPVAATPRAVVTSALLVGVHSDERALTIPTPGSSATSATSSSAGSATATTTPGSGNVNLNLGNSISSPSQSIVIIIALTLLTVAPTLLIMVTSFTRIIIVLSLTRQALGLQSVPPNQVLAGLSLFLTLFIMSPTISAVNKDAVQPLLHKDISYTVAFDRAQVPLRTWMVKQTRTADLGIFFDETGQHPTSPEKVSMSALVPAFILSEMKTAMIIGFVIFIPFLVIDLIVSSSLMSMGMAMLPPVTVSLPFKILLFVLVDGWGLVVKSLLTSFH